MTILNTFANQSGQIPLSQLDSNFATPITIGTTPIILGDIATTITGLTLAGAELGTPTGNLANCIFPTLNQNTTGTASNVTGVVAVGNGGTGVTTSTGTGNTVLSTSPTFTGTVSTVNLAYTGTLTGGTGVVAIGTNQIYKDASGNVGIGTTSTSSKLNVNGSTNTNSGIYLQNQTTAIGVFANEATWLGTGTSNNLAIASYGSNSLLFGTNGAERMRIDASGNLLVGATSVIANGKINSVFDQASKSGMGFKNTSATATGYYCAFYNSAGTLQGAITQTSSTVTAYNVTSDKRLKIDKGVATDTSVIDKTTIHDFEWKADGVLDRGVFAQEAQLVKPSAVTKGKDDLNEEGNIVHPWAVDYAKYVPDLIVYCQQLKKQNQEQQTLIEALTARLTALEAK
jgi:hypothetical protein